MRSLRQRSSACAAVQPSPSPRGLVPHWVSCPTTSPSFPAPPPRAPEATGVRCVRTWGSCPSDRDSVLSPHPGPLVPSGPPAASSPSGRTPSLPSRSPARRPAQEAENEPFVPAAGALPGSLWSPQPSRWREGHFTGGVRGGGTRWPTSRLSFRGWTSG